MKSSSQEKFSENIFLDFMNPELREAWGVNENNKQNFNLFKLLINLSVFLTKEYCILPPAFVFEDPMSFKLVKKTSDYIKSGYIYVSVLSFSP